MNRQRCYQCSTRHRGAALSVVLVGIAGWENAYVCLPCAHAFERRWRGTAKWRWLTTTVVQRPVLPESVSEVTR